MWTDGRMERRGQRLKRKTSLNVKKEEMKQSRKFEGNE